ncbi:MAG TPA: N-acetylmuramoyl-L-alanine amidase [Bryobacteraceae bacterium]|jgi:N-acetylmuramoyl-L-alanine amidase
MRLLAAFTASVLLLAAQTERPAKTSVTAVRHWSMPDVTRVAVEISGEFNFVTERLHNPERVYFDIPDSRPRIASRRFYTESLEDKRVKRIRVAETLPGVTRVVLDLADETDATPTQLTNPYRLIISVRTEHGSVKDGIKETPPARTALPKIIRPDVPPPPSTSATEGAAKPAPRPFVPPVDVRLPKTESRIADAPRVDQPRVDLPKNRLAILVPESPAKPLPVPVAATESLPEPVALVADTPRLTGDAAKPVSAHAAAAPPGPAEIGRAARHTATGETSLVRALGLKVGRVVIDPGHGGHDVGTQGKTLLEKDVVLDVARRVGKLIESRLNAEVVYTRSDDTFIPLEGRTALANDRKADLFLSIHANSSPSGKIAGVETYYLNFADSKDALDVASRENASSQKSVFELRDIIQKITLHDKAEESKEFAGRVQTSLYGLSAKNFPNTKNRGVKKAPFVVLIGASMPSILAEIGFLSNQREEALLKRSDYRQKLAEALYRGVSKYADSLSHFQVAQAQE